MESYSNGLYQLISDAHTSLEEVKNILNQLDTKTFGLKDTIDNLLEKLLNELEQTKQEFKNDPEKMDIIKPLEEKIKICQEFAETLEIKEEDLILSEEEELSEQIRIPIFANSVIKDVKKIPNSEYQYLRKAFDIMLTREVDGNSNKSKILNENEDLKDIVEFKNYQARILTLKIIDNFYYVFAVVQKKGDWPKSLNESIIKKRKAALLEIEEIKKDLQDPKKREKIIEENSKTLDKIKEIIKDKKETKLQDKTETIEEVPEEIIEDKTENATVTAVLSDTIETHEVPKEIQKKIGKRQISWDYKFSLLQIYFDNYKTLENLTSNYLAIDFKTGKYIVDPTTQKPVKLGYWFYTQKRKYKEGKLKEEHLEKLKNLGFLELQELNQQTVTNETEVHKQTAEEYWDYCCNEANKLFEEKGAIVFDSPRKIKNPVTGKEDALLVSWIIKQIKDYKNGKLSEEQISKLGDILPKPPVKQEIEKDISQEQEESVKPEIEIKIEERPIESLRSMSKFKLFKGITDKLKDMSSEELLEVSKFIDSMQHIRK